MLKKKSRCNRRYYLECTERNRRNDCQAIEKATKLVDKDLFLGLGWLLREDKVSVEEVEGELFIKLI